MLRAAGLLLSLIAVTLLLGCGSSRPQPEGEEGSAAPEEASMETQSLQVSRGGLLGGLRKAKPSRSRQVETQAFDMAEAPAPAAAPPPEAPPAPEAKPETQEPVQDRMIHYEGQATVRSTEPEKALDSAVDVVRKAGGYLERRSLLLVVLRVPSERFDSLFQRLMRLGEVVAYSQQAEDITESYQDTDLRLRVVVSTLQRLEALVKTAKTEAQKMLLLERLRQLREEREVLEARKRELSGLARFATITLQFVGHDPALAADAWRKDVADFTWIHGLDPFNDARFAARKTLKFEAPAGMIVTSKGRPWRATGSQGSEFWGSRLKVGPQGDSRFWSEAVRLRLQKSYKATDTSEAGGYRFNRFKSYGPNPYYYWVGVKTQGKYVHLVELYFPSEELQARQLEAVLGAVKKGDG